MFVNQKAFEEVRRHQQVTKYEIYPLQSEDVEDYQILVEDIPSLLSEDVRILQKKAKIPFWAEEKGKAWSKIAKLMTKTPQELFALSGNPSASDEVNGSDTFNFFDNFDGDLSKWGTAGAPSVSGGKVTLSQDDKIRSLNQYGSNIITRIDFQRQSASASYGRIGMSNSILSNPIGADDTAYRFVYDSYEDFYVGNEGVTINSPNDGTYNTKKKLEIQRKYVLGATVSYLTGWSKSGSNPLKDIGTAQGWFCAVYNEYDGKFYLYVQDKTGLDTQFQCYSFLKADAETPANWTNHGNVFTASESWENGWIEPHSIIWETQAMADAREGVGAGLGTQKWRIYYCAKQSGGTDYATGFAVTSESDMTTLTAYSGNPVYPHDASYTYPDCKAVIYNNEVWMLLGRYVATAPQNCFFTHSTNGLGGAGDPWTDVDTNYDTDWLLGTLHILDGGMNVYKANDATMEAGFSVDGTAITEYSGNPTLIGTEVWEGVIGWLSVAQTKNGNCLIDSYYYLWYWGVTASVHKLCLAKTQTITEEESGTNSIILTYPGDSESPWTPASNIPNEDMNIRIEQGATSADLYVYLALVRKYASVTPLILQRQISGKADAIRTIVG